MRLSSRIAALGAITILALLGVSGAFIGMALGERQSRAGTETLTIEAPLDAVSALEPLASAAGFTGFEADALGGEVLRVGTTTATQGDTFSVVSGAAALEITSETNTRLYRIAAASNALAPGDVVVVRVDADGNAVAVLRVPADLREGDAR